jgi:type II secretory pathway pseudopilin PulG
MSRPHRPPAAPPLKPRASGRVRAGRARVQSEAGFTLIEIIAAALIVVVLAAGIAQGLIGSAHLSANERLRSLADQVAQQDQERLTGLSDQQLTSLRQTRVVQPNPASGTKYTVLSTATFQDVNGASSCASGTVAYFKLVSTVTWSGGSITEEGTITRQVGAGLRVKVVDETGVNPLPGVGVTSSGPSTQSGVTDDNGCTVFDGLAAGTYTVALSAPGYVDKDGNLAPPGPPGISATVGSTGIAPTNTTPLSIGKAGTINASFVTPSSTVPVSSATPVSASANDISYFGALGSKQMSSFTSVVPSAAATMIPAASLFPFAALPGPTYTGNYQIWAGKCQGEEPYSPPTLASGATAGIATVTPGSTASATVAEPSLDLLVKYNGTPLSANQIDVKFTYSSSSPSCTDTWAPAAPAGTDAVGSTTYLLYAAPFASNAPANTTGAAFNGISGTVSLCADYKQGSTYYKETRSGITTASSTNNISKPTPVTMDLFTDSTKTTGSTGC